MSERMERRPEAAIARIIVVICVLLLLAAIAIPSFVNPRSHSCQYACINNLRQIQAAKDQAALANNWTKGVDCDTIIQCGNGWYACFEGFDPLCNENEQFGCTEQ